MTATTAPQDLSSHSWNALLKITALTAVALVLVAGSFALGRSTADDSVTIVRRTAPAISTPIPSLDDVPAVALRTGASELSAPVPSMDDVPPVAGRAVVAVTAYGVPAVADPSSCGHTAHTAPC